MYEYASNTCLKHRPSQLLRKYLGRPVLDKMREPEVTNSTLVLQTCGPTLNMPASFERVMALVQKYAPNQIIASLTTDVLYVPLQWHFSHDRRVLWGKHHPTCRGSQPGKLCLRPRP